MARGGEILDRPQFIIIGAMKCATSSLHEQLDRQPGIFMSRPKEPCFFSDDVQYRRGLGWYRKLFRDAPAGAICGESSTHYTKRPTHPHTVGRLRRHLPHARLIYVMRHPVDRLVSQYIHEWSQRVIDEPIDEAIEAHPFLIDYSRYAMQLRPYLEAFGARRVLPVFLERLRAEPQAELERIGRFIGYEGLPRWEPDLHDNASVERLRVSPVRDRIVNLPGLREIRRTLIPQGVRDRVKRLWAMKEPPKLSDTARARVEETFDRDLATLGTWLGVRLNCGNFKRVTAERPLSWTVEADRIPA